MNIRLLGSGRVLLSCLILIIAIALIQSGCRGMPGGGTGTTGGTTTGGTTGGTTGTPGGTPGRTTGGTNGGTTTGGTTGTPPPPTDITAVNHIIWMVQENRSFDHYFGHLNTYRVNTIKDATPPVAMTDVDTLDSTNLGGTGSAPNCTPA